jgi:putative iron-regulated protein
MGQNQVSDEADVTTGWHAIEFLLWGQDQNAVGTGQRQAADYVPGTGNNDRRRSYLHLVTQQLVGDLDSLVAAWSAEDAGSYANALTAMDQREALGRILNGVAVLAGFEMMSERLAVALDSGDQEDEHSCFSDSTHQDFVYDIRGIRNIWFDTGLETLVRAQDAGLADQVTGLINRAEAAIAAMDAPFDRVLASEPGSQPRAEAERAVGALDALAQGLKQVGHMLGVLVLIPS